MEKSNIFDYYAFGYNYNILLGNLEAFSNLEIYNLYAKYITFIDKLNLNVTKSAIRLKKFDIELDKLKILSETHKNEIISKELHDALNIKLILIDTVLDAELNTKVGYILDQKRHSNEILTEEISKLFNNGYFSLLPSIAQHDFSESGLCLAFDRFTACAFHALRATEDVLKTYYSLILNIVPNDSDTWGTFETAIKNGITNNLINPKPSEQLIINIGSIRKYYRNKTQHPQLIYSADDAQDLLTMCTKTVNELTSDLKLRNLI